MYLKMQLKKVENLKKLKIKVIENNISVLIKKIKTKLEFCGDKWF